MVGVRLVPATALKSRGISAHGRYEFVLGITGRVHPARRGLSHACKEAVSNAPASAGGQKQSSDRRKRRDDDCCLNHRGGNLNDLFPNRMRCVR